MGDCPDMAAETFPTFDETIVGECGLGAADIDLTVIDAAANTSSFPAYPQTGLEGVARPRSEVANPNRLIAPILDQVIGESELPELPLTDAEGDMPEPEREKALRTAREIQARYEAENARTDTPLKKLVKRQLREMARQTKPKAKKMAPFAGVAAFFGFSIWQQRKSQR